MRKFFTIVILVMFSTFCYALFVSCDKSNQNGSGQQEEPTLAGIWLTDTYTVTTAISDSLAQEMKDDWLNSDTFFRITEDMLLYVDDKYNNAWPPYTLSIDEELSKSRFKIGAIGDPRYVKMTLYWEADNNKLTCIYTNNVAVAVVELSKSLK